MNDQKPTKTKAHDLRDDLPVRVATPDGANEASGSRPYEAVKGVKSPGFITPIPPP